MIRVVSTNSLSAVPASSRWLFIGSYQGQKAVSCRLPADKRVFIGKRLEELTEQVRDRFVNCIGAAGSVQKDQVLWYSTRMASKSNSQTPLFDHYVYFKLLEDFASRQEDIVVVTDDIVFLDFMSGSMVRDVVVTGAPARLWQAVMQTLAGWGRCVQFLAFWLLSRSLPFRRVEDYDVLIHTWIDQRTFSRLPELHDSYLGELGARLEARGLKVARIMPLVVPFRFWWPLREHFNDIIYPFGAVSFFDLCRAMGSRLRAEPVKGESPDDKVLAALIESETVLENRTKDYLSNIVLFYGYRRAFENLKGTATVFYPFENQPWEKMLLFALPKGVRTVGYAHATIPSNWLDYRVSPRETQAPRPDVVLTAGPQWAKILKQYMPGVPVETAGAIRFEYLLERQQRSAGDRKVIVVALPIDPLIALSLQSRLLALLEHGGLEAWTVKVKPHPRLPADAILAKAFAKHDNCAFVQDDMAGLLNECGVLITAASTVIFEALAVGVRAVVYMPETVPWGLEGCVRTEVELAYEEDFEDRVLRVMRAPERARWDVREYFSEPQWGVFSKHLNAAAGRAAKFDQ